MRAPCIIFVGPVQHICRSEQHICRPCASYPQAPQRKFATCIFEKLVRRIRSVPVHYICLVPVALCKIVADPVQHICRRLASYLLKPCASYLQAMCSICASCKPCAAYLHALCSILSDPVLEICRPCVTFLEAQCIILASCLQVPCITLYANPVNIFASPVHHLCRPLAQYIGRHTCTPCVPYVQTSCIRFALPLFTKFALCRCPCAT